MKRLILISVLLIFTSFPFCRAQMARLYTSGAGLANSQINSIYQDSRGFIWTSTENGLSRFDGMNFTTFRSDHTKSNAIASNLILTTFEDSEGTFWVGTSAGLQIFDTGYNTFRKIDLEDKEVPGSDQHISSLTETEIKGRKRILAASSGHGIYVLDPKTHKIDQETQRQINVALSSQFVYRLFVDSQERLWIASDEAGLTIFDLERCEAIYDIWGEETRRMSEGIIHAFAEDKLTGNILLGTFNKGILIYDNTLGMIRQAKGASDDKRGITAILQDNISRQKSGRTFIVGIENGGMMLFDLENESFRPLNLSNVPYGTDSWKVHVLMEDRQGNVWVGAYQTGIMVIPRSMYGFDYMWFDHDNSDTSGSSCVTSIISDTERDCKWIGTDGGGLYMIEENGNMTHFCSKNSDLPNNSIMAVETDKHGRLWIATYLDGLFTYSHEEGFRQFRDSGRLITSKISCLEYSEADDIMYVGTFGNGFAIVDAGSESVTRIWNDDDNKWISTLYLDDAGMLWVGTYNGPMAYDNRVKRLFTYDIGDPLTARTHAFCESTDGMLWIGTGEGLVCADRAARRSTLYSEDDGLPSNTITSILECDDGSLWIATMKGLSHFNPKTGTFKNYYQHDGLQENEFHAGAACKDKDGKMYFGGIKGVTSFYPHIVDKETHQVPPLYISGLEVMNEAVDYDPALGSDNILDKHITEASQITLPYNAKVLSLEFSVLEYTNPMKLTYSYMMDGLEKEWHLVHKGSRIVTYTNLPHGRYTMKVKAFFDGVPETYSYREIGIRILPPWYLSAWAWIAYGIIAIMAFMARSEYIRRRNVFRKEKEESEIKELKLQMFTNISHEIRTPLTLVMAPLKKMREAENDLRQKDLYNLMYRNCLRILRLVNQLLDMRKVDSGQMKLHFLETDIVYFVKDIMKSFDNMAVNREIDFSINTKNESVSLWIDQGNFDKIIFNILSNAFKHTPDGGAISISISETKKNDGILNANIASYVEFTIENTGSRVEEKHLDKLFDRFFQSDILDARTGSGVGLNLAKMLVELHHGDISAYNTENGVAFRLRIPSGKEHLSAEEMTRPKNHKDLYTSPSHEDITDSPDAKKEEKTRLSRSKRSIVLVDDDSEMRAYLKLELQHIYNVEVCSNGKEAWKIISTTIPDAVITDLMMEDLDGAELCKKIRKNPGTNHIPVILLTSSTDDDSQQRCIDSGADRYFTKPLSLEILKSAIANAITTRDTMRNKFSKDLNYGYGEMQMPNDDNKFASKVIEIIRKNIEDSGFGVEQLSREIGVSRVHLNRKLKESMNISPSNLIKSIRLKSAAYLLIHNKVNISEVAYKVGFSSHTYFSNSFHDYFGMAPKEFVKTYADCTDEEMLKKVFD